MRSCRNTTLRDFPDSELADVFRTRAPEDGSVAKGSRAACHRSVRIPAWDPEERTRCKLAFAVGAPLFERLSKLTCPPDAA
jgi:hypothetical protein